MDADVAGPGRIKGAAIRSFLQWYTQKWGQERLQRVAGRVGAALRDSFDLDDPALGVLAATWYPAPAIHALLDSMQADHPREEHALIAREGARAIIDTTLKGVYRWLFETMMTPDRYARNAQTLFSRYYEPGIMTKTWIGTSGHLTVVRGWTGHHPLLCEFLIYTAEYVYGALGCKSLQIKRTACVRDGAEDCRFEVLWQA